jgi:hypothetical protein
MKDTGNDLERRRWIRRQVKKKWMEDRRVNEQNCDNKTQAETESECHGDKDESARSRSELQYGPPRATSVCLQYLRPIQYPL